MAEEKATVDAETPTEREFEFLEQADSGHDVTVRDDQYTFFWLLDGARLCRRHGKRFRLIDSGRLRSDQMEDMGKAGADIYTSDRVRREINELVTINDACRSGRSILAGFIYSRLTEDIQKGALTLQDGKQLAGSGIYLHLTNREIPHPFSMLNELAFECAGAGSWLVYYHTGALVNDLADVAGSGAWIHLSGVSLETDGDALLLLDLLKSARSAGTGIVLHIESRVTLTWLRDFLQAGGYLQFRKQYFDYRSPYRAVEDQARRKVPDFRVVYLDPVVFP
ncbi:MAG: hypothetical protein KKD59_04180 [Acidobacteria bacterium]|nr:hypothetical protein [Acidobacteriota bacterium]MBU4495216.1 hypothetical protein [Acidobacteriota bacterium]